MKRLFALLLIAMLFLPTAHASISGTHDTAKSYAKIFPVSPHINVTRVIDLSYGYLANVTDNLLINSTKPFNAFSFALPAIAFDISVYAENASAGIEYGKTFIVNGTVMKRFTVVLDKNVSFANITVKYYFYNVRVVDKIGGEKPKSYDAFAIVEFTTVPMSKYTYDYVMLNVTFPPKSKPRPDLSVPSEGNVSVVTMYRRFENYTALVPGYDLRAVAETSRLPYVVHKADMTIQLTSGGEVYVKASLDFVAFGNVNYTGPFTSDQPKTAIRELNIFLPNNITEVKFYDDLGVLVNYTKISRGDYYDRKIKLRTPLVGNVSTYHLTIYYKLKASLGVKVDVKAYIPKVGGLIEKLTLRVISPPFGAIASVKRIAKPQFYTSTGSRHLPVMVAESTVYNLTDVLYVEVVAYRSLMTYIGIPILGSIALLIIAAITLRLISLIPAPEVEEKELPEDVKRAIEVLEELASVGPTIVAILEKPMKLEERIRLLENIRATAERKLEEAISAVNKVSDKDIREILLVAAGIGSSIVSAIRRIEDIERLRPKITKAVYSASIAEAAAFIDSAYRRMMAILVNVKL